MKISASLSNVGETVSRKAELSLRPTNAMDAGFRSRSRAAVIDLADPATASLDDAACIGGAVRPLEPVPTITQTSPFSGSFQHFHASRKMAGPHPGRQRSCAEHPHPPPSQLLDALDEVRWTIYHPSGNQYNDTAMAN